MESIETGYYMDDRELYELVRVCPNGCDGFYHHNWRGSRWMRPWYWFVGFCEHFWESKALDVGIIWVYETLFVCLLAAVLAVANV